MFLDLFLRPRKIIRNSLDKPNAAFALLLNVLPALVSFVAFAAIGIFIAPNTLMASIISPIFTTFLLTLLTYLVATSLIKIPQRRSIIGIWQAFSFGWCFLAISAVLFAGFVFVFIPGLPNVMRLKANNLITDAEFQTQIGEMLQNVPQISFWMGFLGGVTLLLMIYMLIFWYIAFQETVPTSRLKQFSSYIAILLITVFAGFLRDAIILNILA